MRLPRHTRAARCEPLDQHSIIWVLGLASCVVGYSIHRRNAPGLRFASYDPCSGWRLPELARKGTSATELRSTASVCFVAGCFESEPSTATGAGIWRTECPCGRRLGDLERSAFQQDELELPPPPSTVAEAATHGEQRDWRWFFAARGLPLRSPAALLLHVVSAACSRA